MAHICGPVWTWNNTTFIQAHAKANLKLNLCVQFWKKKLSTLVGRGLETGSNSNRELIFFRVKCIDTFGKQMLNTLSKLAGVPWHKKEVEREKENAWHTYFTHSSNNQKQSDDKRLLHIFIVPTRHVNTVTLVRFGICVVAMTTRAVIFRWTTDDGAVVVINWRTSFHNQGATRKQTLSVATREKNTTGNDYEGYHVIHSTVW